MQRRTLLAGDEDAPVAQHEEGVLVHVWRPAVRWELYTPSTWTGVALSTVPIHDPFLSSYPSSVTRKRA